MLKQLNLRRCPSLWGPGSIARNSFLFKVFKNLLNGYRIFHTGDDPHRSFAPFTDLDINMAYRDVGQGREQERKL